MSCGLWTADLVMGLAMLATIVVLVLGTFYLMTKA